MQFNDLMDTARRGNVRAIDYGFNRMAQNDNRRDILFAGLFRNNGKDLVIDICITNACCKTYTPLSCDTQGHAVSILEERKMTNIYWHTRRNLWQWKCMALATSDTFNKFFRRLATEGWFQVSEATDIPYCISLSYWQ